MGHGHLADTRTCPYNVRTIDVLLPIENIDEIVGMSDVLVGQTIEPYGGFVLLRVCKEKEGDVREVTLFLRIVHRVCVNL